MTDEIWKSDAKDYQFDGLNSKNISNYVVETQAVSDFLTNDGLHNKHFVVGVKGSGKTHLLSMKSKILRENKSLKIIPKGRRLLSHLGSINIDYTNNFNLRYFTIHEWEIIWKTSITYWLLRNFNIEIPKDLKERFGEAKNLKEITQVILGDSKNIELIYIEFSKGIFSKIDDIPNCRCFLDNLDQAFSIQFGENETNYKDIQIWSNAQAGLLFACVALMNEYKHIKIYASIRAEAFYHVRNDLIEQVKEEIVFLRYSREDLKKIIAARLERTILLYDDTSILKNFKHVSLNSTITHTSVVRYDGEKEVEELFNYIYRHTFGKPREIINTYAELLFVKEELNESSIKRMVNEKSFFHINQLTQEVVNDFNFGPFDEFCKRIKSNVISLEEATKLSKEIEEDCGYADTFTYLFKIGLIGRVRGRGNNTYVQEFKFPCEHTLDSIPIGNYKYYVIHPSVYEYIREKFRDYNHHEEGFLSQENIIGNNLAFHIDKDQKSENLHLHFGLDRTSVSVILPEIINIKPLLLIIDEYELGYDIVNCKTFELTVTSKKSTIKGIFNIYTFQDLQRNQKKIYREWIEGENILLIVEENTNIDKFTSNSSTISLTESSREYIPFLRNIDKNYKVNNLYLISRHHKIDNFETIYNSLSEILKKKSLDINLSLGLADTFQLNKNINIDENKGTYKYEVNTDQRYLRLIKGKKNKIKNSGSVTRHRSIEELKLYEVLHRSLLEGIYQFSKLVNSSFLSEELIYIFNEVQVNSILDLYEIRDLKKNLRSESKSDCTKIMNDFGLKVIKRVSNLIKDKPSLEKSEIVDLKSKGIFPIEQSFEKSLNKIWDKYDKQLLFQFKKYLSFELFDKSLKKVFISYETKDKEKALNLYWSLKLLKYDCWIFEIDKKMELIRNELDNQIDKREIFIFIASKHSIYSNSCHREISKFRSKRGDNKSLICFKIDNDIFNFDVNKMDMDSKDEETDLTNFKRKCSNNIKAMNVATIHDLPKSHEKFKELFCK